MSGKRCSQDDLLDRIDGFVAAGKSSELGDDRWRDFEQFLRENDNACRLYAEYMDVSIFLPTVLEMLPEEEPAPSGAVFSQQPPTIVPWAPEFPGNMAQSAMNYLSSGWPVAYLVATVIFAIAILIGSLVPVSQPVQVARQSVSLPTPFSPLPTMVGRVTGMVDCRFDQRSEISDPKTQVPRPKTLVSLGDKFSLASGLMEITYDTGAKVILQGPVTYDVESAVGGFLSVGKLTARVDKKGSGFSGQGSEISKSQVPRPKTQDPRPNSLFAVRTPTAAVTDLGTEFGVEVDRHGATTSHVFCGSIRVQPVAGPGRLEGATEVLHENQSVRIEGRDGQYAIMRVTLARPADFVREIPRLTIKTLDLVDVVAGGDGFSGRRNRGIDPRSGRVTNTEEIGNPPIGDGKYHRVEGMPFVDGIFIPNSVVGPVQLDSAGHVFAEFPATDNKTCNALWAGKMGNNSAELDGINYASPGHGNLAIDANQGITFDLEAIRRANPDCKLVRFRAVTGNAETVSEKGAPIYADVWVFVDGQVQFRRREINRYNGAMPIMFPINDKDRFLTLVATDGGHGYLYGEIIFGDPRLELVPAKAAAGATQPREAAEQ